MGYNTALSYTVCVCACVCALKRKLPCLDQLFSTRTTFETNASPCKGALTDEKNSSVSCELLRVFRGKALLFCPYLGGTVALALTTTNMTITTRTRAQVRPSLGRARPRKMLLARAEISQHRHKTTGGKSRPDAALGDCTRSRTHAHVATGERELREQEMCLRECPDTTLAERARTAQAKGCYGAVWMLSD